MERPDPARGIPDGWRVDEWEAFGILTGGGTYKAAAEAVGRAPSTVSRWVRRWRDRWGDDVFVSENHPTNWLTDEQRARGAAIGGLVMATRHADNRAQMALEAGETADHARAMAAAILRRISESEDKLDQYGPKEVLELARAHDLFAARADALADLGGRFQDPRGAVEPGVDLSALEARAGEDETQELLEAAGAVIRRFKLVTGAIEVDEVG